MPAAAKIITTKPDITTYHDYFAFFKDWMDYMKSTRPGFSNRTLARDAGLAVGYLPMVLSGQRQLSSKALEKIIPHLGLTLAERKVFEKLRIIGESEVPERRIEALRDLQRSSNYKEKNKNEWEVHRYLSHWMNLAIRELARLPDFNEDPEWIQERLRGRFPRQDIEDALRFLEDTGFLVRGENRRLQANDKTLRCEDGVYKISLAGFHRQILDEAARSIENVPRSERLIMGHTKAMSPQQYARVSKKIQELIADLENDQLVESASETEIYHVEVAAFPLTKRTHKETKS